MPGRHLTPPTCVRTIDAAEEAGYRLYWADTPCTRCGATLRRFLYKPSRGRYEIMCDPCQRRHQDAAFERRKRRLSNGTTSHEQSHHPTPEATGSRDDVITRTIRLHQLEAALKRMRELDSAEAELWLAHILQLAEDCTRRGQYRKEAIDAMARIHFSDACHLAGLNPGTVQTALEQGGFVARKEVRDRIRFLSNLATGSDRMAAVETARQVALLTGLLYTPSGHRWRSESALGRQRYYRTGKTYPGKIRMAAADDIECLIVAQIARDVEAPPVIDREWLFENISKISLDPETLSFEITYVTGPTLTAQDLTELDHQI